MNEDERFGIDESNTLDLVADAVQRSVWHQIEYPFRSEAESQGTMDTVRMKDHVLSYTGNKCEWGCALALGYLAQRDKKIKQFDFYALVSSYGVVYGDAQLHHSYFLARSNDTWYGSSPSNLHTDKRHRELDIYSGTLKSVLFKLEWTLPIARFTPWPGARYIQHVADTNPLVMPKLEKLGKYKLRQTCLRIDRIGPYYTGHDVRPIHMNLERVLDGDY